MRKNIILPIICLFWVFSLCACGSSEKDYVVGESVTMGTYEQDGDTENGKEPIEWIVVDKSDNRVLLLSKYVLDTCAFNEQLESVNWQMSTAYQEMNNEFYNNSFNDKEKKSIVQFKDEVTSEENGYIFFLSFDEVLEYFDMVEVNEKSGTYFYSQKTLGEMTPYALNQYNEASQFSQHEYDYLAEAGVVYDREVIDEMYSAWWLRKKNDDVYDTAYFVGRLGNLGYVTRVSNNRIGVRPAMYVNIK